jgi:2'-5' RNA ligase
MRPDALRLFVGIALSAEVLARLREFVESVRPLADLRWSHLDDLHITTKFVGEQPASQVSAIARALDGLRGRAPFDVVLRGTGWFPREDSPRVFWAGVEAADALTELATDTERALETFGVAKESRPYVPHLTLGRVPRRAELRRLRDYLAEVQDIEFGRTPVDRFALYESRGGRYVALEEFRLDAGRRNSVAVAIK